MRGITAIERCRLRQHTPENNSTDHGNFLKFTFLFDKSGLCMKELLTECKGNSKMHMSQA